MLCLLLVSAASAVTVTPNWDAAALAGALVGTNDGFVIRQSECRLQYSSSYSAVSCGTYTNASGLFEIGPGIVFSTGNVSMCTDLSGNDLSYNFGMMAPEDISLLLTPITGSLIHYDATLLDIVFDLLPGYNRISMDAVFGSEEYPRWLHTPYNDGLGVYLNGQNIALVDSMPLNINNPFIVAPSSIPDLGNTGLDGVLALDGVPLLNFGGFVENGSQGNHLIIVIGDASDAAFDTVAFLGNLRAYQAVPEPSSIISLGLMSAGAMLAALRRRLR